MSCKPLPPTKTLEGKNRVKRKGVRYGQLKLFLKIGKKPRALFQQRMKKCNMKPKSKVQ